LVKVTTPGFFLAGIVFLEVNTEKQQRKKDRIKHFACFRSYCGFAITGVLIQMNPYKDNWTHLFKWVTGNSDCGGTKPSPHLCNLIEFV